MAPRNKLYRLLDKYKTLLVSRLENKKYGTGHGVGSTMAKQKLIQGNRSKNKILNFFRTENRWPKRNSEDTKEASLGTKLENFLSKESRSYDPQLRRIVMLTGRKSNHKRKHNIKEFKQEILDFVNEHGRVPSTSYECQTYEGEARLRHKLDYYTKKKNDMTLLGQVYAVDKCHLSGIPLKYRALINEQLNVSKPLVRLVKS